MSTPEQGFGVDADRLGTHAAEFEGLAERAGRISDALRQTVGEGDAPWGTDAVGESFAAAHTAPAADALDWLAGLSGGLGEVGGKFGAAARAYRAADEGAASDVTDAGSAG